ncbi:MAG: DUF6515 family protein [Rikenellaceae bacterium]
MRNRIIACSLFLGVILLGGKAYGQQREAESERIAKTTMASRAVVVKYPKIVTVRRLAASPATIRYDDIVLYFSGGKYYRCVDSKFILTLPPVGVRVATIPSTRLTFEYRNRTYYSYNGILYTKLDSGEYEVAPAQLGMIVPELPEANVSEVSLNGTVYFEHSGTLFKQISMVDSIQYEVVG